MLEEPDKLIGGLQVILRLFPNAKGVLAVEDNKPDCIKLLTEMTSDEPRITVKKLKTKYPQGSERQLIFAVTGRAHQFLHASCGCRLYRGQCGHRGRGQPCGEGGQASDEPYCYRHGDAIANPQNFIVRIGTNYHELIEEAAAFPKSRRRLCRAAP